ncbi:MAG: YkgJ family cysteine cluster protein [Polyangiaceae bacterium]
MSRPRLSDRCLPRLHFTEGRCVVVLHDRETGDTHAVGPSEWVLLSLADGTRDLDGVLLGAQREGVNVDRPALEALLAEVGSVGLLAEGPRPRAQRALNDDDARARPIRRLPGYAFRCDGRGSCCRSYSSIVFTPLEAARARASLPMVLDGGARHEHAFTPESGAGPCTRSAIALVDGGCAYLDGSACGLHRTPGPRVKPLGCAVFPTLFVDDGAEIRAAVSVECGCVLASVTASDGAPLVPDHVATSADLEEGVAIERLPEQLPITARETAPRATYVAWGDRVLARLEAEPVEDAARLAWDLAGAIEAQGTDHAWPSAARPTEIAPDLVAERIAGLGVRATERLRADSTFRGPTDLTRRATACVAASAELLAEREILAAILAGAGAMAEQERFYLRAVLFGQQLASAPLDHGLRDRAVAMWVARAFPLAARALYPDTDEIGFEYPLALVEMLLRNGLRR